MDKELPSTSDIAKTDNTELQEITENAVKSTEELIVQSRFEEMLPMYELLRLDKELRSIRGLLKVEMVKKVQLKECIEREKRKLAAIRDNPDYDNGIREDIKKQITNLNDNLKGR